MTHERGEPEQTPDGPEIDQLLLNGDLSLGKKGGKEWGEKSRMREEGGREKSGKEDVSDEGGTTEGAKEQAGFLPPSGRDTPSPSL